MQALKHFTGHLALCLVVITSAAMNGDALLAQTGQISGRILGPNGQVLSLATVRWEGATEWTAVRDNGTYTLTAPSGDINIVAQAFGYRSSVQTVVVPNNGSVTINFDLEARPFDVLGIDVSVLRPDMTALTSLEDREIDQANPLDAGDLLRAIEGVDAVRRGALGLDPVVRGLRETQVGTYLDGTRLFPAGPARMDSPLTHLDPSAVRNIQVVKGPYALTWGAGNLSAIRLETQPLPEVDSHQSAVALGYDTNLSAAETSARFSGRSAGVSYALDGAIREGHDYLSGSDSIWVPATFSSRDVRGKLGIDIGQDAQVILAGGYQDQGMIDYPGQLLTAEGFEAPNFSSAFEWTGDGTVSAFRAKAYRNRVTHDMSNRDKPSNLDMPARMPPCALEIRVDSEITVVGGNASVDLNMGGPWTGEIGADVYSANRDATRSIVRSPAAGLECGTMLDTQGASMTDRMWPDATITDVGGFSRVGWRDGIASISGTVRVDAVRAVAPKGEVSSFFLSSNPSGSQLDSGETNLSAAASASFDVSQHWIVALGLGSAVRTADASERYSDRIPSSKAQFSAEFVGDPQLKPERSNQADMWLDGRYENFQVHLGAFARKINNYITIQTTSFSKRLPLSPPTVFQYINGEATFYGFDGSLGFGVSDEITLGASGSYLYGRDDKLSEPAIGISPVQASLSARYEHPRSAFYVEGIARAIGPQRRVAVSQNEGSTEGYQTGDIRSGFGFSNGMTLRTGILNIWNTYYANHLNSLDPFSGIQIPEPGRIIFFDIGVAF